MTVYSRWLATLLAVAETVREMGVAPSGVVYATLMEWGVTAEVYEAIRRQLVNAKLIEDRGETLHWIGPELEKSDPAVAQCSGRRSPDSGEVRLATGDD